MSGGGRGGVEGDGRRESLDSKYSSRLGHEELRIVV